MSEVFKFKYSDGAEQVGAFNDRDSAFKAARAAESPHSKMVNFEVKPDKRKRNGVLNRERRELCV